MSAFTSTEARNYSHDPPERLKMVYDELGTGKQRKGTIVSDVHKTIAEGVDCRGKAVTETVPRGVESQLKLQKPKMTNTTRVK